MTRTLLALAVFVSLLSPARAGIADSPLPLLNGVQSQHVFSVPGVIRNNTLDTVFMCTSVETANNIRVGVELFASAGGGPINNVSAGDGAIDVAPGQTVTIITSGMVGIVSNTTIGGTAPLQNGSARIVSTSKKIVCTALLADEANSPPTSMTYLTIIAKTKQKASN